MRSRRDDRRAQREMIAGFEPVGVGGSGDGFSQSGVGSIAYVEQAQRLPAMLDRLREDATALFLTGRPFAVALEWANEPMGGAVLYRLDEVCADGLVVEVLAEHATMAGMRVFIPVHAIRSCWLKEHG